MAERRTAIFEARERLARYSDALWAGRTTASGPLADVYTQRLAVAARLVAQLWPLRSVGAVRELLRQEDRAFPRELLATDEGRTARGAFNLLVRAAAALEEQPHWRESDGSAAEDLVGEQLSAVTFLQDYVQLDFDGPRLTVLCPCVVHRAQGAVSSTEPGFRDALCSPIGQIVRSVSVGADAVIISFDQHKIELLFGSGWPDHVTLHDRDWRTHTFAKD